MSQYTQEELANTLQRIQERKKVLAGTNTRSPVATRDYREGASHFNQFAPEVMDTKQIENPFAEQIDQTLGRVSSQATAASGIEAQNRYNWNLLQEQKRRLEEAKKNRVKPSKQGINPVQPLQQPQINPETGLINTDQYVSNYTPPAGQTAGTSYYTQTPSFLDPSAGLTTFAAAGHKWTVNASVAGRFKGFINALAATGYKIKSAGSYVQRNQANGSGNPSLHSYGLAIDINPAQNSYNPGGSGAHHTNLPKGISALAAKYGLVWGGDWKNSKDYMHFSIPYKGLM